MHNSCSRHDREPPHKCKWRDHASGDSGDRAGLARLERRPGWEDRLAELVASERATPFAIGRNDCVSFACAAVRVVTGVDFWPDLAGRYRSTPAALKLLRSLGGFEGALRERLGLEPTPVPLARRGDLAVLRLDGHEHLAVIVGSRCATPSLDGLALVDRSECAAAWKIG